MRLPDDCYELRHAQLLGNEEFGFVQIRKRLFFVIPFHDDLRDIIVSMISCRDDATYWNLCRKLGSNSGDFLSPSRCM